MGEFPQDEVEKGKHFQSIFFFIIELMFIIFNVFNFI